MDLGLERSGLICRWQVEIDAACRAILEARWPGVKRYGDIRSVTGNDLEPVDVLAGGFPCQDLSQAGKRAGIEGDRSGLWFEFARLIGELRPRYVLIENVAGLLVHDAMRRVVGELAGLGYVGCWRSLRASEFGASHIRKRIFIVAVRMELAGGELLLFPRSGESDGFVEDAGCTRIVGRPAGIGRDRSARGIR
jgi:DNA (cytosine-5)-methyltransferase 1